MKDKLKHMLLVRDQQMMHDAVAKIGREDFARLGTVGNKADPSIRCRVAAPTQGDRKEKKPDL